MTNSLFSDPTLVLALKRAYNSALDVYETRRAELGLPPSQLKRAEE